MHIRRAIFTKPAAGRPPLRLEILVCPFSLEFQALAEAPGSLRLPCVGLQGRHSLARLLLLQSRACAPRALTQGEDEQGRTNPRTTAPDLPGPAWRLGSHC